MFFYMRKKISIWSVKLSTAIHQKSSSTWNSYVALVNNLGRARKKKIIDGLSRSNFPQLPEKTGSVVCRVCKALDRRVFTMTFIFKFTNYGHCFQFLEIRNFFLCLNSWILCRQSRVLEGLIFELFSVFKTSLLINCI